jgi:hypothetical protein
MKKFFKKLEETLADAALLEMGVDVTYTPGGLRHAFKEAAYAEAADYDQIQEAILREHSRGDQQVHPDECQYGDNDFCFVN